MYIYEINVKYKKYPNVATTPDRTYNGMKSTNFPNPDSPIIKDNIP